VDDMHQAGVKPAKVAGSVHNSVSHSEAYVSMTCKA
jgi:hypothetical protein